MTHVNLESHLTHYIIRRCSKHSQYRMRHGQKERGRRLCSLKGWETWERVRIQFRCAQRQRMEVECIFRDLQRAGRVQEIKGKQGNIGLFKCILLAQRHICRAVFRPSSISQQEVIGRFWQHPFPLSQGIFPAGTHNTSRSRVLVKRRLPSAAASSLKLLCSCGKSTKG